MSSLFTVGNDYRSDAFRARLNESKIAKIEGGLHWKFADRQNLNCLSVHMYDHFQRDRRAEMYKTFTPYKLEVENTLLFNEWYFNFLWNFIGLSSLHQAYIAYSLAEFVEVLDGPEEQKMKAITSVQEDFSNAFKECVLKSILKGLVNFGYNTVITKEFVETRAIEEFAKWRTDCYFKPEVPFSHREKELVENCTWGDAMPYAIFLMAYDYPEDTIWDMISTCLLKFREDDSEIEIHKEIMEDVRCTKLPLRQKLVEYTSRIDDEVRLLSRPIT